MTQAMCSPYTGYRQMSGEALTLSSTNNDAMTSVKWDLTAADLDDVNGRQESRGKHRGETKTPCRQACWVSGHNTLLGSVNTMPNFAEFD